MAHAFARGLGSLSVFRFLLGLGEAGNWPGAAKVIAEWFPVRERAFAMAVFNSGAAIGSVVAPPIIVWLQLSYGWQTTFIVTGALGFLWLALWLLCYQSPDRHRWITDEERALIAERGNGEWGVGSGGGGVRSREIDPTPQNGAICCGTDRSGPLFLRACLSIRSGGYSLRGSHYS
jgi:ACS family hexuronate transporter-like MFS transporter